MRDVIAIEQAIRALVNDGYYWGYTNDSDKYVWSCICSCMDWIQETEYIIDAYRNKTDYDNQGQAMIHIVGLLEALYIGQTIVKNLRESIGEEKLIRYGIWEEVNNLRTILAGHPTSINNDHKVIGAYRYTSPDRDQVYGEARFALWHDKKTDKYDENHTPDSRENIDLLELISRHRSWLRNQLRYILVRMIRIENKWRNEMSETFSLLETYKSLSFYTRRFETDNGMYLDKIRKCLSELEGGLNALKLKDGMIFENIETYKIALNFYESHKDLDDCPALIARLIFDLEEKIKRGILSIKSEIDSKYKHEE